MSAIRPISALGRQEKSFPICRHLIAPSDQHVSDGRWRASEDAKLALAKARAFIELHERPAMAETNQSTMDVMAVNRT
jgi:hypothetical protein